ncbi:MAG: recombinase family protein [Chloroflexota bacterium]
MAALRPEFQRMMRDAEAGLLDVIIVHKLDRFSRSLVDTMTYLKQLNELGVSFVSVTESFDFTTPGGKMMMRMLAMFAEWYIDNLSQETSKGKKERARKGGWNGALPFGYTTVRRLRKMLLDLGDDFAAQKLDEEDYSRLANLLEETLEHYEGRTGETDALPCPINGHGVILAFEKYSQGIFSDLDVAQALNTEGYRTTGAWGQNPFGKDTITPMLQNRFYIGETSYQGKKKDAKKQYIPGRHEPLISRELFEKCQEVRAKRAVIGVGVLLIRLRHILSLHY